MKSLILSKTYFLLGGLLLLLLRLLDRFFLGIVGREVGLAGRFQLRVDCGAVRLLELLPERPLQVRVDHNGDLVVEVLSLVGLASPPVLLADLPIEVAVVADVANGVDSDGVRRTTVVLDGAEDDDVPLVEGDAVNVAAIFTMRARLDVAQPQPCVVLQSNNRTARGTHLAVLCGNLLGRMVHLIGVSSSFRTAVTPSFTSFWEGWYGSS